jgi:hypothetical protein
MARVNTKIGDVFSVKINDQSKKYFQLIAFDLTQLNSDVIRAFKKIYPIGADADISEITKGEVEFYAHCVTKAGVKMQLWEKVGDLTDVGNLSNILFRESDDYGRSPGKSVVSENWYVWKINDDSFTKVGKLTGENINAHIGLVFNPAGILELLKGNKYPIYYPNFS